MIDASVADAPYLSLRPGPDGRIESRGLPACQLGQPLDYGREVPDGVFAWWSWDDSTLLARNDRYGLHPLYYALDGDSISLSPSLPRLLLEGAPADLDDAALADFLRTGYFVGEDTPFRAIRALPPNGQLEWSAGRLRISGGLPLPPARALSRDEAIDAYIPLFREAVRRWNGLWPRAAAVKRLMPRPSPRATR